MHTLLASLATCVALVFLAQATWNERMSSSSSHPLPAIGACGEANQQSSPWPQSRCRDPESAHDHARWAYCRVHPPSSLAHVTVAPCIPSLSQYLRSPLTILNPAYIGPFGFQNNDMHVSLDPRPCRNQYTYTQYTQTPIFLCTKLARHKPDRANRRFNPRGVCKTEI
jgi:hypothetical protein